MIPENYTPYHVHTMLSNGITNIDSITDFHDYIDMAKQFGMKAFAFSEHGSIFNWVKKKEYIEANGMKYIHAIEAYITEDNEKSEIKTKDNYHIVLIAKNYDGVKELNKITSKSFCRNDFHYYYVPRISFEELFATSDNVIITTACLGGILYNGTSTAKEKFLTFLENNKHRCFLEIQHHNCKDQIEYNKLLYKLHKDIGVPLIAGTDTHALNEEHMEGRAVLQKSKGIHFADEDAWDLIFKSVEQLIGAYEKQKSLPMEVVYEAINNTNVMADMVEEFKLDTSTKYPKIYKDSLNTFREKVYKACESHPYITQRYTPQEIRDTVDSEIEVYEKTKSIDFMLLQTYLREWEKENGIECGYGRGSVSGSEVAYALGITQMDSKRFGLNFFRFMNPARVTNADIDTDYSAKDREKVKRFILKDHMDLPNIQASEIITFNTIALKGAIRDVCRALYKNQSQSDDDYLKISEEIIKMCENNEDAARKKYPKVFKYVDLVNGTVVSIGSHPSGILVSDLKIDEEIGLCSLSTSEYPVSMLNMKELDQLFFVKLDVLGLDNLGIINETCNLVGIERLTPDNVDLEIPEVWEDIRDDTTLIFQFESNSAQSFLKKFMSDETLSIAKEHNKNFSYIKWLSFGNGLIRPGCASFRDNVANGEILTTGFKELDDFLSVTFGRIVMQEDIMKFLVKFCGYSDAESDTVRRCVDGDTLVMMGNGDYKKIKDIEFGDTVQTINDDNISEFKSVKNVFYNGTKETYKIKAKNGYELIATGNHRVLTQNGWKQIDDLTVNDYLMTPRRINPKKDELISSKRLSEKEMYLIGLLIGDGSLNDDIHFINHETVLIDKFKECVQSRSRSNSDCKFCYAVQNGVNVDKVYSVRVTSKRDAQSLETLISKLGLKCKSAQKKIPKELMNYPKGGKLTNLLAGLFNTDGGYNIAGGYIDYSSISYMLVLQIKSLLLKYGIYSYVYKSYVSEYGYYSYRLIIGQKDSLIKFKKSILPYIIGEKHGQFNGVINGVENNSKSYNYLLPNEFKNEMCDMSRRINVSIGSILQKSEFSKTSFGRSNLGITDKKAWFILNNLYCPMTYRMLLADYMPVKIKSIEYVGKREVYDIEVEDNHNYIANGVIVHNCIAKKYGTESVIDEIHDRFISYSNEKYGQPKDFLEEVFLPIKQGILDATRYAFSWNHSDSYSSVSYICGYLRYYYPLEFITTALNVFEGKEEKTLSIIDYAKRKGIKISPIKFRRSTAKYNLDKDTNSIYKGISSIKYMNANVADEMYALKDNTYPTFIDLLYDLEEKTTLNSKQLEILIELDFFSEFGETNYLLKLNELFSNFYGKVQAKKDKLSSLGIDFDVARPFASNETEKMFTKFNSRAFLTELSKYINAPPRTLKDKISAQIKHLGYCDIADERYSGMAAVLELDTKYSPKLRVHSLKNGTTLDVKIDKKTFNKNKIAKGDIIRIISCTKKPKMRKGENGFEPVPNEFEMWLTKYSVINGI